MSLWLQWFIRCLYRPKAHYFIHQQIFFGEATMARRMLCSRLAHRPSREKVHWVKDGRATFPPVWARTFLLIMNAQPLESSRKSFRVGFLNFRLLPRAAFHLKISNFLHCASAYWALNARWDFFVSFNNLSIASLKRISPNSLKVSAVRSPLRRIEMFKLRAAIKIYATFLSLLHLSYRLTKDYSSSKCSKYDFLHFRFLSFSLFFCFYGFWVDSYVIKQRFLPFSIRLL